MKWLVALAALSVVAIPPLALADFTPGMTAIMLIGVDGNLGSDELTYLGGYSVNGVFTYSFAGMDGSQFQATISTN